jgi:chromosome segregation ATPase
MRAARKEVNSMQSNETKAEDRFDRIEGRLTRVDGRLEEFGDRLGRVEVIVTGLEIRVAHVEVDVIETMSDLKDSRTRLEDGSRSVHAHSAAVRKRVFADPAAVHRESCDRCEKLCEEMYDRFQSLREQISQTKFRAALFIVLAMLFVVAVHWV